MIRRFSKLISLFMLIAASPAYGEATGTEEEPACKDPYFFGIDLPIQDYDNLGDQFLFDPVRYLTKTESGFIIRISSASIIIDFDAEKEQINQLAVHGILPSWINDASFDVGHHILKHYLNYVMTSRKIDIIGFEGDVDKIEKILFSYGGGHETIETCEVPNCGCIGFGQIFNLNGVTGPNYSIVWKR
ncbi:hypothetical protein [Pararhizobium sp. IMCC21322]|uniref:hypothetical protein n=1 Tax=Pararhizobium sp. IMCC21322 TaxID=3067903 RepID=UPI002740EBE6|nr:hypothetical protein [Pararhizobium sp. IMCC21322]